MSMPLITSRLIQFSMGQGISGDAEVVSCRPVASERRNRVCVEPDSMQNCPEKDEVLCAKAISFSGQFCIDSGSTHTLLRRSDATGLQLTTSASPYLLLTHLLILIVLFFLF